jgi:ribosomal protein S18 acetylase RimI-like enzyme
MVRATASNPPQALRIAALTASDTALVCDLAHRIWPVSYADILTPEQISNMLAHIYNSQNLQREMQQGHRFWAAYDGDTPLGFVSSYREDDIAWLRKLYVLPDARGIGIGQALMIVAFHAFAPSTYHRLLVNRKNLAAQRFYRWLGFDPIGEVEVQMGDFHFNDFIFSKEIV